MTIIQIRLIDISLNSESTPREFWVCVFCHTNYLNPQICDKFKSLSIWMSCRYFQINGDFFLENCSEL